MFREGRPVSVHGRGFGKARTQETEGHEADDKTSSVAICFCSSVDGTQLRLTWANLSSQFSQVFLCPSIQTTCG